jgi:S1-C subfamily serine protease
MQIITSPTGAVVNSVQIGSAGDHAGFEPGDVIAEVAGSQIDSARSIQTAVTHVPVGGHVTVQIARGSSLITMAVTMQGRPTLQP